MKVVKRSVEDLMKSPVGQSMLAMIPYQEPLMTASVSLNEYSLGYTEEDGLVFLKFTYAEVVELFACVKMMKEAGELQNFDADRVKWVM